MSLGAHHQWSKEIEHCTLLIPDKSFYLIAVFFGYNFGSIPNLIFTCSSVNKLAKVAAASKVPYAGVSGPHFFSLW